MGAVTRARGAGVDESLRRVTGMSTTLSMSCAIGTEVPHLDRAMGFLQNASLKVSGFVVLRLSHDFSFRMKATVVSEQTLLLGGSQEHSVQQHYNTSDQLLQAFVSRHLKCNRRGQRRAI